MSTDPGSRQLWAAATQPRVRTLRRRPLAERKANAEQVKPSLKAKHCPRVSCRQKRTKTHATWTLIFNWFLEVVKIHVRAKFHQAKCSGSWVIEVTEKNCDDAENNTAFAYAGSKNVRRTCTSMSTDIESDEIETVWYCPALVVPITAGRSDPICSAHRSLRRAPCADKTVLDHPRRSLRRPTAVGPAVDDTDDATYDRSCRLIGRLLRG